MSQNQFSKVMAKKSDSELTRVLHNLKAYTETARLAAALELINRGNATKEIEELKDQLSTKLKAKQEVKSFENKLFSKSYIYLWAFLVTPILIGAFMSFNIWELGNRKRIWTVLGIAVLYIPLILITIIITPQELGWLIGFIHLAYTAFLVEWTWKKYIPTFEEYNRLKQQPSNDTID